jgi:5-methylcytosine-specific restriction enzyme A
MDDWYFIDKNPAHTAKERKRAQELKKSQWWKQILAKGICHYCGQKFGPKALTMDHIVPVARGGTSTKGNVVPSCKQCNTNKKLHTPVELAFKKIAEERDGNDDEGNEGEEK